MKIINHYGSGNSAEPNSLCAQGGVMTPIFWCLFLVSMFFPTNLLHADGWSITISGDPRDPQIELNAKENTGRIPFSILGYSCAVEKEYLDYGGHSGMLGQRSISCDINGTKVSSTANYIEHDEFHRNDMPARLTLEKNKEKVFMELSWVREPKL